MQRLSLCLVFPLAVVSCGAREAAPIATASPAAATTAVDNEAVAADATLVKPLVAGAMAPAFLARRPGGSNYAFDPDYQQRLSAEKLLAVAT